MPDIAISHRDIDGGGVYLASVKGSEHKGRLEWKSRGQDVRVATHTVVPSPIGGRGVAARLVEALVADARRQGFRIVAQCSYVARAFERHPEWRNLLVG